MKRLAFFACMIACGCQQSPSRDEIDRMVDERLAARASASSSAQTVPNMSMAKPSVVSNETAEFLSRLDDLMRDFKPNLPAMDESTDVMRCVTTEALNSNADLQKTKASIRAKVEASRRERAEKSRAFYAEVYPAAFRIDYDWQSRKTEPIQPVFDCFNVTSGRWTRGLNQQRCTDNPYSAFITFEWKAKVPGKPSRFLYSGSDSPPTEPTELMKRLSAAGIAIPARLTCRVTDIVSDKTRKVVVCADAGSVFSLRVEGTLAQLNVGDVVSAPLADAHRDPDGVLSRQKVGKVETWILDVEGKNIQVTEAAKCPTVEEVVSAAK